MKEFLASATTQRIIYSLLTVFIAYLVTFLFIRVINKNIKDLKKRYKTRKGVIYAITLLSILTIILIWIRGGVSVTTIIGVTGAGLTLALHQPITSMAGWILIVIRRPYDTGDRIQIGDMKGDVIDIRLFYTTVLEIGNWVEADQSTGRIVHIPNGKIFTDPIYNYTTGFEYIWNEIKTTVTFESNWKKAQGIILRAAEKDQVDVGETIRKKIKRMSKKYLIHYEKLTPYVWVNIGDSGIELILRYLTDARTRRSTQHIISQEILNKFQKEPDIELAYPTYRIYKK